MSSKDPTATLRPNAVGFITGFPNQYPLTESGTDTLDVDGYGGANAWTTVGTAPWLDAADEVNRIETATDGALSYEFTFEDSILGGHPDATISTVLLRVRARGDGDDTCDVELWDGLTWSTIGTITPATTWTYYGWDVTSRLDTKAKIDAAKVRFTYHKTGKAGVLGVDHSYLGVSWYWAPPHWTLVDDVTPDEDSTRIWTSETDSAVYSLYNAEDFVLPAGMVIDRIEVFARVKGGVDINGNSPRLWMFIRTHDTNYEGLIGFITSDLYHYESYVWTTNPYTGLPWTEAEINALQIGPRASSSSTPWFLTLTCTQVYVVIYYSYPAIVQAGDGLVWFG